MTDLRKDVLQKPLAAAGPKIVKGDLVKARLWWSIVQAFFPQPRRVSFEDGLSFLSASNAAFPASTRWCGLMKRDVC